MLHSVPVAASLCVLAVFGLSSFPEEGLLLDTPVNHMEQVASLMGFFTCRLVFLPEPSELPVWKCHSFSSDANYTNYWNFGCSELFCTLVDNMKLEDTIGLPES